MEPRPPGSDQGPWNAVLRLMQVENWFMGVGIGAVIVAAAAALVLQAGEPARTVAEVIVAACAVVIVVCVAGWVVSSVKESRAFNRIAHLDVIELMDKGSWDDAIAKLEVMQTSEDADTRLNAWNMLAQCYAATGRNADSEAVIHRSIDAGGQTNEQLGEQLTCLGAVLRRQDRLDEAEQVYAKALDLLRPVDPEATVFALKNIAYLYWVSGQQDRAREIYDEMPDCDAEQFEFLAEALKPYAEPPLPVPRV